jgi:hypothetical protein
MYLCTSGRRIAQETDGLHVADARPTVYKAVISVGIRIFTTRPALLQHRVLVEFCRNQVVASDEFVGRSRHPTWNIKLTINPNLAKSVNPLWAELQKVGLLPATPSPLDEFEGPRPPQSCLDLAIQGFPELVPNHLSPDEKGIYVAVAERWFEILRQEHSKAVSQHMLLKLIELGVLTFPEDVVDGRPVVLAVSRDVLEKIWEQSEKQPTDPEAMFQQVADAMLDESGFKVLNIFRNRDLNADQKMRKACEIDRRYEGFSSIKWAKTLGITDQAVRQTEFWRERQSTTRNRTKD